MTSPLELTWFKMSPLQNNLGSSPGREGYPGAAGFLVARDRQILQQPAAGNNGDLFWNQ